MQIRIISRFYPDSIWVVESGSGKEWKETNQEVFILWRAVLFKVLSWGFWSITKIWVYILSRIQQQSRIHATQELDQKDNTRR
jgi:hypothetical protein